MQQQELLGLLEDMTLKEKIDQLFQAAGIFFEKEGVVTGPQNSEGFTEEEIRQAGTVLGSIGAARLKKIQKEYIEKHPHQIPLIFMADIINGYRTIFPIPLAQGSSFDTGVARCAAAISAKESAAAGLHVTFSPMADLVRDARWGRSMESPGEDVYLNSMMVSAMVEGYQGTGTLSEKGKIAACVKHFAGYGAPLGGRDYNTVELSERTLREEYLPAYKKALDTGAAMVMTSFNTLGRVPSTVNRKLLRDILRKEMNFEGVVISDWASIEEVIAHGVAADKKEAARLAIEAGVDIDMMTGCYCKNLEGLVKEGTVEESFIDEAVLRILELKNKLGLFENPYKDADEEIEKEIILCEEHRNAARKAAADTFVLLKNEGILPLQKEQRAAWIGPHVSSRRIYGGWSMFGREEETVSIEDGVRAKGITDAVFAEGCAMCDSLMGLEMFRGIVTEAGDDDLSEELYAKAETAARDANVAVLALGEHPFMSGEAASLADIGIPKSQMELLRRVGAANPNVVVVLFNGRPLDIRELCKYAKAVMVVWQPGTEGGNAIADVLYGAVNPNGKLSMSFPYGVGQCPVSYCHLNTGRPYTEGSKDKYLSKYIDIPNEPLYPFGFGLSYTSFEIGKVKLDHTVFTAGEEITASVLVKNTGAVKGKEVIQMYIRDLCGTVARPVRELKGFVKTELLPGEEREISFIIREEMLRFYDIHMNYVSEPGEFMVSIGNSSDTRNEAMFVLKQRVRKTAIESSGRRIS